MDLSTGRVMFTKRLLLSSAVALGVISGLSGVAYAAPAKTTITHTAHFAGYEVTVAPTTATTSFSIPAISCTSTFSAVNAFVGLNNFTTNEFDSGGIAATCEKGTPQYAAYTEINNAFYTSSQQVNSGDAVTVTVSASSSSTTVTVDDATTGSSTSVSQSGPGGGGTFTSVSIGAGGEGANTIPPPTFDFISFSGSKVNGVSLTSAGSTFEYEWYTKKVLVVGTSHLSAGGTAFTVSQPGTD
jgi:hypothetical protein